MVIIRLARGGRVHRPIYKIVAADSRKPRDGRYIEKIGQYDPHATEPLNSVMADRVTYWVSKGARVSDSVSSLLKRQKIQ